MKKLLAKLGLFLVRIGSNKQENELQKQRECNCIQYGHMWATDFNPKEEIKKPIEDRTYCKICGVKYHKHEYQTIKQKEK